MGYPKAKNNLQQLDLLAVLRMKYDLNMNGSVTNRRKLTT